MPAGVDMNDPVTAPVIFLTAGLADNGHATNPDCVWFCLGAILGKACHESAQSHTKNKNPFHTCYFKEVVNVEHHN